MQSREKLIQEAKTIKKRLDAEYADENGSRRKIDFLEKELEQKNKQIHSYDGNSR